MLKFFIAVSISLCGSFMIRYVPNRSISLEGLKYIDHNMENKTIFDKFEYYSLIHDREKQIECFNEILNLNRTRSSEI